MNNYKDTLMALFFPKFNENDSLFEWKNKMFSTLCNLYIVAVFIPIALIGTLVNFNPISWSVGLSCFVFIACYIFLLLKKTVLAANLILSFTFIINSYCIYHTGINDVSYLYPLVMLLTGISISGLNGIFWALLYSTSLYLFTLNDSYFSMLPDLSIFNDRLNRIHPSSAHFSTSIFLLWACQLVIMLLKKHIDILLKSLFDSKRHLEEKVKERTTELIKLNERLEESLEKERQLRIALSQQAVEEKCLLEDELLQARKMEAIGHLAGGIAHDFNNILTGIQGYAELLRKRLEKDTPTHNYANQIIQASRRASELTHRLLAFARKGKYKSVPIDIHKIINEVIVLLQQTFDKRIELQCQFKAFPSITVGDPSQLHNALLNLAINGRDAMQNGGVLTFSTQVIALVESDLCVRSFKIKPGDYILISVKDTGTGMNEDVRSHLFEPFFTTKEKGRGTGLGLASVYGCIQNHVGAIEVRSVVGQGTDFKLYLPLVTQHAEVTSDTTLLYIDGIPKIRGHLLLVDDEEVVRNMVSEMLSSHGFGVTVCEDGLKAIDLVKMGQKTFDMVILDMIMPKIGGRETFIQLKKLAPGLKIAIVSGYSIEGEAQELITMGAAAFIQKPFSEKQLLLDIVNVLSQESLPEQTF